MSYTLDSIGPMARTVQACADADAVMAGEEPRPLEPVSLCNLTFGVIQGQPLSGLDGTVGERFGQALTMLGRSGCRLSDKKFSTVAELPTAGGALLYAEAFAIHEERLRRRPQDIDRHGETRRHVRDDGSFRRKQPWLRSDARRPEQRGPFVCGAARCSSGAGSECVQRHTRRRAVAEPLPSRRSHLTAIGLL